MLVLHHQGVRPAVPQADPPDGEPADVAVGHVGVLHQLRLVLAVQLAASWQHGASPLPGVLQRQRRTAELRLKANIPAIDANNVTNLREESIEVKLINSPGVRGIPV